MAHKPISENTDLPDEPREVRYSGKVDIKNQVSEMSINPKMQDDNYDNPSINQFATKQDIQSQGKDIKAHCENTDIRFVAVDSNIDRLRTEMITRFSALDSNIDRLRTEMNANFESFRKECKNTMFKLMFGYTGCVVIIFTLSRYLFD